MLHACTDTQFFFIVLAMSSGLILAPPIFVSGATFSNWRDFFLFGDFSLTSASFTFSTLAQM